MPEQFKRLILFFLAAAFLAAGCAGVAKFKLPEEFHGKKQVEDPPL